MNRRRFLLLSGTAVAGGVFVPRFEPWFAKLWRGLVAGRPWPWERAELSMDEVLNQFKWDDATPGVGLGRYIETAQYFELPAGVGVRHEPYTWEPSLLVGRPLRPLTPNGKPYRVVKKLGPILDFT